MYQFLICLSALFVGCWSATVPLQQAVPFEDTLPRLHDLHKTRIVNGFPADLNQIPYQCSILSPTVGGFTVCGCSLIALSWTLSAAHCTIGHTQFNFRFGSLNLLSGGYTRSGFHVVNHPAYNPGNGNNDISLLHIGSQIQQTPAIQVIRIAGVSHLGNSFVGVQSRVSGFGQTHMGPGLSDTLNWVFMNPISNAQCANVYGTDVVAAHVICAIGWDNPNQGHCAGDAGGPLAINEAGIWTLIGVTAFGAAAGCESGYPHGYMRAAEFAFWITQQTGIAVRP